MRWLPGAMAADRLSDTAIRKNAAVDSTIFASKSTRAICEPVAPEAISTTRSEPEVPIGKSAAVFD